ncbi:MAG: Crp/Fnr family transcriptional regulator [Desulfobacterales bacterium]|nr:Crp/Fnr family transcriptional regulator [Desulfobacterales bacterium]
MENIIEFLGRTPLFSELPRTVMKDIAGKLEKCVLEKGELLFQQGAEGDSLYILSNGSVKVFADKKKGEEPWSIQYGPGVFLGEMAIIEQKPRSASVAALEPVELFKLKKEDFLDLLEKQPAFALGMMRSLAARLRFASVCLTKSIEWSKHIAAGRYNFAIKEIKSATTAIPGVAPPEDAKVERYLSYFSHMVEGVKQREDALREAVCRLRVKVDNAKRVRHVSEITDTDYFRRLKETREKKSRSAKPRGAYIRIPLNVNGARKNPDQTRQVI